MIWCLGESGANVIMSNMVGCFNDIDGYDFMYTKNELKKRMIVRMKRNIT